MDISPKAFKAVLNVIGIINKEDERLHMSPHWPPKGKSLLNAGD